MVRTGFFSVDSLKGVHVLVADDEPLARDLLKEVLEYCGALVFTVASANDALSTMRLIKPDVLVARFALPDEDALWLLRSMRNLKPEDGGKVPLLVLGGTARDAERAIAHGVDAHLAWPIDPWEFSRTIASLVTVA
jgi:CheY-like chemotaxis protein